MAKWIERGSDMIINLDFVYGIECDCHPDDGYIIRYRFINHDVRCEKEVYSSREGRDKRFEEIKAMLLDCNDNQIGRGIIAILGGGKK